MSEDKTSVHSIADLLGAAKAVNNAYLIVISAKSPAGIGRMIKLERAELVMGRSTEVNCQVEDDGVSRKHAKVSQAPNGQFQLVDLGSTNGTYLNGIKVSVATLQDGDKIQVGSNTVFKFSIQDKLEEEYQRNIYESATRDGLTRIFNKKYFIDTLKKEFAYCLRHRVPLSLVMLDIDHFKKINDTNGHLAGDYVLRELAHLIKTRIRKEECFARYGGEEFAVVMPEAGPENVRRFAEKIRKLTEDHHFNFEQKDIPVTISLGVADMTGDMTEPLQFIKGADGNLYKAKKGGRNRVTG